MLALGHGRLRAPQGRVAQAAPPLPSALSASRSAVECALPIPRPGTSDLACRCLCSQLCSGIPELADGVALRVSLVWTTISGRRVRVSLLSFSSPAFFFFFNS